MLKLLLAAAIVVPVTMVKQPPEAPPQYVTIVVKACPADPKDTERCEVAAMGAQGLPMGYCPKAVNQGMSYEHVTPPTKEERNAYYASIGCIDVAIPPEVLTGEMTLARCKGHAGYIASLQYLEQNQTIEQKAVGGWACIVTPYPAEGVTGM